ncbi:Predicted nuclease (RNAse H fold) [Mesobacillus persicus]|uniref:Predicted nuclease (RNAse H fold) n=1 Tax=Mesobacillus persicus TaxID=930146 RepID=A0A1H7Z6L7_9BACI|nr:DUF429 domain-containing protein [Mesobacillus persicus]SEM53925.1 Predicted nuclease (RNAse H fold) [Mesobacillus persicus]
MKVIGIDLSGPANHKDTVLSVFQVKDNRLVFEEMVVDANDEMIISTIKAAASIGEVVIGIDAPLSYQDGGGDRPQDKSIRQIMKSYGLSGSSIMPPTLTRMVYLTLRGVSLTRRVMMMDFYENIQLVEVHPGAAIGTRIGKEHLSHALLYKKNEGSSKFVLEWFDKVGMVGVPETLYFSSHQIDACAAALAAWHWADSDKQPTWHWKTTSAAHPFEFCC